MDRRLSLLFLTEQAHPLLELMRDMGRSTRHEATVGFSEEEEQLLLQMMKRMRSNLIEACSLPIDQEKQGHD
jgi:DNA-binding MarR family transcriptional regulator